MNLTSFFNYHLRHFGHYRFKEPILVIESDDWGKVAGKSDGNYPSEFGQRTEWSYDQLEAEEELEGLYTLLESFKNDFERGPVFTANFIVSNPDFERIREDDYMHLHLKPIDEGFPQLHNKWLEGKSREVFYPQYHGRLHYNQERYLQALQTDEKTRFLFNQGINGGMENFSNSSNALYSEYFRADSEGRILGLKSWIERGLIDFERIFGMRSVSTIAPNYYLHPSDFEIFAECGIRFLQGGNKILYTKNGMEQMKNYCQGTPSGQKLTILARNHKFEPNRNKREWQAEFSIEAAKQWFKTGAAAVLDTHRFNYVSRSAANSHKQLRKFLEAMREIPDLQMLTTPELGEAMANEGKYVDVFSGEIKQLTPMDSTLRRFIRVRIS